MDILYLVLLTAAAALNFSAAFSRRLAVPAAAATTALALYHFALFFADGFDVVVVYINAARGMPPLEKAAAALASIPGAVFVMATALVWGGLRSRAAHAAAALLLAYAAAERPFETVPQLIPGYYPHSGMGLNPLLRSVWAVPHPVAVLVGYGLLLAGAAARSHGAFKWGWLSLSLGLFLGAVWSYQTFGWSGYWAWDPVENALLAVWLTATAALHLKNDGGRIATAGVLLGAVAVNQGGFSALHSFVGSTPTPQVLLAASLALTLWGLAKISKGIPRDPALAATALGMAGAGVFIYATVAFPALYSALLGASIQPPSGDAFVSLFVAPLALAVYGGLALSSLYYSRQRSALLIYALWPAAAAALAAWYRPAFESPWSTNFLLFLLVGGAAASVYFAARSQHSAAHRALHAVVFALVAAIAVSGPFSYSQAYYKLTPVEPGGRYVTLWSWPSPAELALEVTAAVDSVAVEVPPTAALPALPNYTAYVKAVGGVFSLSGLNYTVVDLAGVKYVVVWSGGRELGRVGAVPVVEVERNGTAVVFPAPLDLVEALSVNPGAVRRFLECGGGDNVLPRGVDFRGRVYVDGADAVFTARYDASGWLKGVGGLVVGVADVYKPLVGYNVVLAPAMETVGGAMWDAATAAYVRELLSQCNAGAAYAVLASVGARNLTQVALYLAKAHGAWVAAVKPVPLISELYALSAAVIALSAYLLAKDQRQNRA